MESGANWLADSILSEFQPIPYNEVKDGGQISTGRFVDINDPLAPQPRTSSATSRKGIDDLIDALLAAQHVMAAFG